jgi:hypothetical protein
MSIDIEVQLDVTGLDHENPAFEQATEEFISDVRETPELAVSKLKKPAQREGATVPTTKGGTLQEILVIASAPSSAATVVSLFKLWLKRDRHRTISLKIKPSGKNKEPITVEASGENVSLATLEKVIESAFRDMG